MNDPKNFHIDYQAIAKQIADKAIMEIELADENAQIVKRDSAGLPDGDPAARRRRYGPRGVFGAG